MMHKQEALGRPIKTDRESSQRFPGRPSNFTSYTISIWSPLQPHLSGLHQVAFLQIFQCCAGSYPSVGIFAELLLCNGACPIK